MNVWLTPSEEQLSALYKKGADYLDQNNLREALKCFLVVAEQTGEKHTEYVVGSIYYDLASDDGDNYDTYREAVNWFRKSADQGNPTAQYCLGLCYYDGRGVDYNRTEAAKWYRKAADQGFADAMYDLGGMYYKGEGGCDRDIAEALKWYKKAKNAGNKDADAMIAYCEEKLNDKKTGKSEFGYEADDPFAILFGALVGAAIKESDKEVGYKETAKNETKNVQQTNSAKSESSGRLDNVQNSPTHSKAVTSATQTPNPTTSLSSSSTNTDGHMLTFSKDVRAKATIYDLLYYPMGVVDLSAFKCTLNYIRDFVKSHYNHTLSEGTDRLIWRKTDEPVKYNIEIDGLQLHEAQFYNSGEDYWNWSYSISENLYACN